MATTAGNPHAAPALPGNTKHSYVIGGSDITLPLTVDATHDQIEFNEVEYLIPHSATSGLAANGATYATIQEVCDALNAATNDEDFLASPKLSTLVVFEPSRSKPKRIKATAIAQGLSTLAFGTAVENDLLASLGMADALALAGGEALD